MLLRQLVTSLAQNGTFAAITANIRAQFGLGSRRYLGAEIMPERLIYSPDNIVRDAAMTFRSTIAQNQPRYSPPVKRSSASTASTILQLAESGQLTDLTAQDMDAMSQLRGDRLTMQQGAVLTNLLVSGVIVPFLELNEYQRWQAMVYGQVTLKGDNMYREVVNYPNPANSRVAITANAWQGASYDAMGDYLARINWLKLNGITPVRSVTSTTMLARFMANAAVRGYMGDLILQGGTVSVATPVPSIAKLNAYFAANALPPVEVYDLQYRTQTGTGRFLPIDAWVITGATGQNEALDLGDTTQELLPDTMGFVGIGTVPGQSAPGRWTDVRYDVGYPPNVIAQGVQVSLPIINQPNALTVMTGG